MTDEYIRKQDAVKASLEFTVEYLGGAFNEGLQKELKTNLESIEPADVAPVVHAHWIDGYRWQTCSECRNKGKKSWKFCPNCGAKMRGEQE